MKLVGAAAYGGVDHGAGGAAILGRVVARFYSKLADGVRRGWNVFICEALVGGSVVVVVEAVEQVVVERGALAIDVEGAFTAAGSVVLQL